MDIRDHFAKQFGEKLKKLMAEKGVSTVKLAGQLKMSRSTFSKYFSGISSPKLDTFLSICSALDCNPCYFLDAGSEINGRISFEGTNKTEEREIIEAFFFLFSKGFVQGNVGFGGGYYVDSLGLKSVQGLLDECERFSNSEVFPKEEVCEKLVVAYEAEIKSELCQKEQTRLVGELPF